MKMLLPPLPVCTFFLPDLRQHSALTDSLHVGSDEFRALAWPSLQTSDSYLQLPFRHFHSNMSQKIPIQYVISLTGHPLSTHLVYICSLLWQMESLSLSNPSQRSLGCPRFICLPHHACQKTAKYFCLHFLIFSKFYAFLSMSVFFRPHFRPLSFLMMTISFYLLCFHLPASR